MDWQDIATAPESGEFLVLKANGSYGLALSLAPDRMLVKSHDASPSKLTHWMPLPPHTEGLRDGLATP
jgi:hypothetical protein